jgi:hypothetical protein
MNPTAWSTRTKVLLAGLAAVVVIGVATSDSSTPELIEPAVALTVTAPPTTAPPVTAPPVTAPPVTAPPVTAPPVTAPPAFDYCGVTGPGISPSVKLSALDTNYSDGYCEAFVYGYTNIRSGDDACTDFWLNDDDDILAMFMSDPRGSYEEAVGLIDALWTVC